MKKTKGFTLIELLAVIVILAVIALIVTPMIMNTINSARQGAAKSSAYEYIHAIETRLAVLQMDNKTYTGKTSAGSTTGDALAIAAGKVTDAKSYSWDNLANHTTDIKGTVYVLGLSVSSADLTVTNGTDWGFTYDGSSLSSK